MLKMALTVSLLYLILKMTECVVNKGKVSTISIMERNWRRTCLLVEEVLHLDLWKGFRSLPLILATS